MSDIFISYASEDRERARVLAGVLENQGLSVWWDRRLRPGQSFDEVIEEALTAARCVIVLWSQASAASNWVRGEAGEGLSRGILIPALIEETRIPLEFRRFHAAHLVNWDGDPAHTELQTLLSEVRALVGDVEAPALAEPPTAATEAPQDTETPTEPLAVTPAGAPAAEPSPPVPARRPSTEWSAEVLAQEGTRRLLRVSLSEDTRVVEYKNQLSGETVSVDGIEVARAGSWVQFVGHHEFEIPDGARQRAAVIDATVHWMNGLNAFRLRVDGQTVHLEGELP